MYVNMSHFFFIMILLHFFIFTWLIRVGRIKNQGKVGETICHSFSFSSSYIWKKERCKGRNHTQAPNAQFLGMRNGHPKSSQGPHCRACCECPAQIIQWFWGTVDIATPRMRKFLQGKLADMLHLRVSICSKVFCQASVCRLFNLFCPHSSANWCVLRPSPTLPTTGSALRDHRVPAALPVNNPHWLSTPALVPVPAGMCSGPIRSTPHPIQISLAIDA